MSWLGSGTRFFYWQRSCPGLGLRRRIDGVRHPLWCGVIVWQLLTLLVAVPAIAQRGPRGIAVAAPTADVERWAVVVGISDYRHSPRISDLAFAHRDAETICQFLRSPAGGSFAPDHVVELTNEEATVENVRRALGTFLAKAAPQDLVYIHFSGHGAPDPNNPKILYLLTHDSDPDSLLATALRMDEVRTIVRDYIRSQRVLFTVDACHSGGVRGTRSALAQNPINQYLIELAKSRPGIAFLTASMAGEQSREIEEAQLGLFTDLFLKGARGAADADQNAVVTLGEVYEFLRSRVVRESSNTQHPVLSGDLDLATPVGIVLASEGVPPTTVQAAGTELGAPRQSRSSDSPPVDASDAARGWIDWLLHEHPKETYAVAAFAVLIILIAAVFLLKKSRFWYSMSKGFSYNLPEGQVPSGTPSQPPPSSQSGAAPRQDSTTCALCGCRVRSPHDIAGECTEPTCEAPICKDCWHVKHRRRCAQHDDSNSQGS